MINLLIKSRIDCEENKIIAHQNVLFIFLENSDFDEIDQFIEKNLIERL